MGQGIPAEEMAVAAEDKIKGERVLNCEIDIDHTCSAFTGQRQDTKDPRRSFEARRENPVQRQYRMLELRAEDVERARSQKVAETAMVVERKRARCHINDRMGRSRRGRDREAVKSAKGAQQDYESCSAIGRDRRQSKSLAEGSLLTVKDMTKM